MGIGPGKSTLVERFLTGKLTTPLPPTTTAGVRVRAPYVLKGHFPGKLSVQFIELPSGRHALAAAAAAHLPTADGVVYVYDCADRKYVID